MRSNIYLQANHTMIVNGIQLTGFFEGDIMSIEVDGNEAERTKGADGPSMNISVAQGGKIEVTLAPNSPAIGAMYAIRELQRVAPTLFGIVLMTGVSELVIAIGCAFSKLAPWTTGGPKMTGRKFSFEVLGLPMDPSPTLSIGGIGPASLL